MNSKKNNKNSPVLDSVSPAVAPIPQPPMSKKQDKAHANSAKNVGSTKDSDPTM